MRRNLYKTSSLAKAQYSLSHSTLSKSKSFEAMATILCSSITFNVNASLDRKPYLVLNTWLPSIRLDVIGIVSIPRLAILPGTIRCFVSCFTIS
ncbi:MAG TPA: hypothetical protein VFF47_00525 [Nitrospirota bacterium]|nr:hypothetical protein [Nitrospirota bacterium]